MRFELLSLSLLSSMAYGILPTNPHYSFVKHRQKTFSHLVERLDNLVPLQRGLILRSLGMTTHDMLFVDETEFVVAVLARIINLLNAGVEVRLDRDLGDLLINTDLERYLPSVYGLSADDVLDSSASLEMMKEAQEISFLSVANALDMLVANTDHRDIITDLNKLDFDAMKELMYTISVAWLLQIAQAGPDFEVARRQGILKTTLDSKLEENLAILHTILAHWKKKKDERPSFARSEEKIQEVEAKVREMEKIVAMPPSPARAKTISEFIADRLTTETIQRNSENAEILSRDKIGLALLEDIHPPTIVAINQLTDLLVVYVPANLKHGTSRRSHLLNLLKEELQKAITDK